MSRVGELIGEVKRPSFDILRAAHVELVVRDLDASLLTSTTSCSG